MSFIIVDEKPSLEDLVHYGVLGMKWGHRKAATGKEIKAARQTLMARSKAYRKESKKLGNYAEGSPKRKALELKLAKQHQAYLKDPARVIASRMTRGEKFGTALLTTPTPLGILASVGSVAATSAASRRIEFKQERGDYNKLPTGSAQKRIGFQRGRALTLAGAQVGTAVAAQIGPHLLKSIGTRAAGKRAAAKVVSPKAIGSTASKLKYIKPKGGVYRVTSLK
jgi:hypothetical protein